MTRINLAPPGRFRKTSYAAFIGGRLWFSDRPFKGVKNTVVVTCPPDAPEPPNPIPGLDDDLARTPWPTTLTQFERRVWEDLS